MKRLFRVQAVLALLAMTACVTVNIYFPAAEVKKDAERVVKEVYGIEGEEAAPEESSWLEILGPASAHAQDYTSLSNAATRGLEQQLKQNHSQLAKYYASGNVGLDASGYATLRDNSGLSVQDVGQVNRLVQNDRGLKQQLYQEKAKAAKTPDQVGKVEAIYADLWKRMASPGTYIQSGGGWSQK